MHIFLFSFCFPLLCHSYFTLYSAFLAFSPHLICLPLLRLHSAFLLFFFPSTFCSSLPSFLYSSFSLFLLQPSSPSLFPLYSAFCSCSLPSLFCLFLLLLPSLLSCFLFHSPLFIQPSSLPSFFSIPLIRTFHSPSQYFRLLSLQQEARENHREYYPLWSVCRNSRRVAVHSWVRRWVMSKKGAELVPSKVSVVPALPRVLFTSLPSLLPYCLTCNPFSLCISTIFVSYIYFVVGCDIT